MTTYLKKKKNHYKTVSKFLNYKKKKNTELTQKR